MIRFKIGEVTFRLHALALLMAALAFAMGAREGLSAILLALTVHESAHMLAAKLLRVRVEALDIMPFVGALKIENPYRLSRWQLLGVALAGPTSNAVGLLLTAALAWWSVLPPRFVVELIRANAMLAAFNLLPALPLDGGRAAYALLHPVFGRRRTLSALVFLGYALAAGLLAAAAAGFARTGTLNLALPLASVFLVAAGSRERRDASRGTAEALAERLCAERRSFLRPEKLRVLAVDEDAEALAVLRALSPREEALIAVYGADGLIAIVDSRSVERALLLERPGDSPLKIANILKNGRLLPETARSPA